VTTATHRRIFTIAADVVVALHMVFVAFLLVGGFVAWWWPGAALIHVLALVVSAGIYLGGHDCPLTNLEKNLRTRGTGSVYTDGFIAHYLVTPLFAGGMTVALGYSLVALVVGATVLAYGRHLI
jgi:hypothetical protein